MSKGTIKNSVWVLTTEYNDYDQHGEYFEAVFPTKPTIKELAGYFTVNGGVSVAGDPMAALNYLLHLLDGGGRQKNEDMWYNLTEVEFGKKA